MSELPLGWTSIPFEEAVHTQTDYGRRLKQRDYLSSGRWPVFDQGQKAPAGWTNDNNLLYTGPLPVIAFGDHTRSVRLIDRPFVVGADGIKLFTAKFHDPKFLSYWLTQAPIASRGYSRHAQFLRKTVIPLPPLLEQHRIVAEIEQQLTRLEVGHELLRHVQTKVERYENSILDSVFASDNRCVLLSELLAIPLRNGYSAKAAPDGIGIRTITLSAITTGDFSERNSKIASAEADRVRDLWMRPGDFLFQRGNTPELVGLARLYTGPENFAIFPDLVIRARTKEGVNKQYLQLVLHAPRTRNHLRSLAQGSAGTMPKIDQSAIESTPIPLPSYEQQCCIAESISTVRASITRLREEIATTETRIARLRQSILAKAYSGEIVPQNPDDEPASALLERIRRDCRQDKQERTTATRRQMTAQA